MHRRWVPDRIHPLLIRFPRLLATVLVKNGKRVLEGVVSLNTAAWCRYLLFLCVLGTSLAWADESELLGVWTGHLGDNEIVVCFSKTDTEKEGDTDAPWYGEYHYTKYKETIPLWYEDGVWQEYGENRGRLGGHGGFATGRWWLKKTKGSRTSGVWEDVKNGKKLPLVLSLAAKLTNDACTGEFYQGFLEVFPPLQDEGVREEHGRKYRALRTVNMSTLELLGDEPGLRKINQHLRDRLPKTRTDLVDLLLVDRNDLEGRELDDALDYWQPPFLAISTNDYALNGMGVPLPGGAVDIQETWDTRTGEQVDVWGWFTPRLLKMVYKKAKLQSECEDVRSIISSWRSPKPYLTTRGILFNLATSPETPQAIHACAKSFFISYAKLGPFLTSQGRAALQAIRNEKNKR